MHSIAVENAEFSFVILTYNEEIHLPRLLQSIAPLRAATYVLDSGSTDKTLEIAHQYGATIAFHAFENHPRQWDFALKNFDIKTPWTIGLDADQIVTAELLELLAGFKNEQLPAQVNGIYFNRKNYFKGRWIRHGGYFPKYLLKMFRTGVGYSDLHENMDHRFVVSGQTHVWKKGYLIEENLKENDIGFWIDKHNRYSALHAREETERRRGLRVQTIQPSLFGSPDQRTAFFKKIWWNMPLFARPLIYFLWRYIFQMGFLDGRQGFVFHFLQAYWYRLIVDIKIQEHQENTYEIHSGN